MAITTPDLSLAGQEAWNVVSIVDYYINLQGAEILNAQEEERQPANQMKLSRRMTAFLSQAVEQEISAAYAGDYKDLWAEPGKEKLVQPLLWEDAPISYPYLMLAAALLQRAFAVVFVVWSLGPYLFPELYIHRLGHLVTSCCNLSFSTRCYVTLSADL